jgi:hypothetical protein
MTDDHLRPLRDSLIRCCADYNADEATPDRAVPGYTLSASGRSGNHQKFVAAQRLSLIRSPDSPSSVRKAR